MIHFSNSPFISNLKRTADDYGKEAFRRFFVFIYLHNCWSPWVCPPVHPTLVTPTPLSLLFLWSCFSPLVSSFCEHCPFPGQRSEFLGPSRLCCLDFCSCLCDVRVYQCIILLVAWLLHFGFSSVLLLLCHFFLDSGLGSSLPVLVSG